MIAVMLSAVVINARAEDVVDVDVDVMEEVSAQNVADYQVEGSLFQQITDLEQEKILMQLEKERAQLDLELDRLAAEKIKLHMEIDALSGRVEAAQQELEAQKAKLDAEAERLASEKEKLQARESEPVTRESYTQDTTATLSIASAYRLVNVIGVGSQLQATVEDLATGQTKRLAVGKTLDGFTVKSISLDDGIVFSKDGETQNLNIKSNN